MSVFVIVNSRDSRKEDMKTSKNRVISAINGMEIIVLGKAFVYCIDFKKSCTSRILTEYLSLFYSYFEIYDMLFYKLFGLYLIVFFKRNVY